MRTSWIVQTIDAATASAEQKPDRGKIWFRFSPREFLAATGGDTASIETSGRPVGIAGLAPALRNSGRVSNGHHRPRRLHRSLQRVSAAT